jgi:hypothetical protein
MTIQSCDPVVLHGIDTCMTMQRARPRAGSRLSNVRLVIISCVTDMATALPTGRKTVIKT